MNHDPRPLPDIPFFLTLFNIRRKNFLLRPPQQVHKIYHASRFFIAFFYFFPSFSHSLSVCLSVCLRGLPPLVIMPRPLTLPRPSCHFSPGENCLGRLAPILSIFVSERQISHLYRVVYVHHTFF
jgi:hypothetical protein